MERKSSYMQERIHNNNVRNINTAKWTLVALGALIILIDLIAGIKLRFGVLPAVNLIIGVSFVGIGLIVKPQSVLTFRLGFILCLLITLLNVLQFSMIGAVFFGVAAYRLYLGIAAAQYFNDRSPRLPQSDQILDADFLGGEE